MTEAYGKSEDKKIRKKLKSIRTTRQRQFISHPYGIEKGLRTELAPDLLEHMFNSLGVVNDGMAGDDVPTGQELSLQSLVRYTHNEAMMSVNTCGICGTKSIQEPHIIDTVSRVTIGSLYENCDVLISYSLVRPCFLSRLSSSHMAV